jgi:TatD DNase family protein
MNEYFMDSHTHLEWRTFDHDRTKVIKRAHDKGVKEIVNIGYSLESSRKTLELARSNPYIYAAVGIHPHEASLLDDTMLESLRKLCEDRKVVAIGEIGLDYYRDISPRTLQVSAFKKQIELASELDLPIIIHNRESHGDMIRILHEFKGRLRGVMHCFSGSLEMAKQCMVMDLYLSFAGPITYPNANQLRAIAKELPLNRLLIETDAPWLAPQPVRGKRNEPAYVVYVAEKIAELKHLTLKEVAESTTYNTKILFSVS